MGELKSLRIERKLTQNQAADILGVSLRSYKSYENDEKKADSIKYKYMLEKISEINPIDEENGIVDIDYIKRKCSVVFDKYNVNFCYLFGSYSKGKAKPTSDVDLLISTDATGLKFYGLVEEIFSTSSMSFPIYISIIVDYTISQSIDCIPWNVSSVEFIFI